MEDRLRLYPESLHDGAVQEISEAIGSEFIDVNESDVAFRDLVTIKGRAYLAGDELVIDLRVETIAHLPCAICNQWCEFPICIDRWIHVVPHEKWKSGTYDYAESLREAIILEIPLRFECQNGNCPARNEYSKYLTNEHHPLTHEIELDHPFANLELEDRDNRSKSMKPTGG